MWSRPRPRFQQWATSTLSPLRHPEAAWRRAASEVGDATLNDAHTSSITGVVRSRAALIAESG
jgi:hypothetical protein